MIKLPSMELCWRIAAGKDWLTSALTLAINKRDSPGETLDPFMV